MYTKKVHTIVPTDPTVFKAADKVANDLGISRAAVLSWLSADDHENRLAHFRKLYEDGHLQTIRKRSTPGKRYVKK